MASMTTTNEETPVIKEEGVKQETIDYSVSEEYKTRFTEAPYRKSKKATFPPGCQVLVQQEEDEAQCLATIQQVGALDIGEEEITDQRYKIKAVPPHSCPREIVWERDLRFAPKTPVWWDRCDGRGSTKPGFVVTQLGNKNQRTASGENLYSIQLFDEDNTIVPNIPQSKLKYNFNPQSPQNIVTTATATTNTIIRSPSNHNQSPAMSQEAAAVSNTEKSAPSSDKAPQQKQKSKKQKSKKSKAKRNDKNSSRDPDGDNSHHDTASERHAAEAQSTAAPKKRAPTVAAAPSQSRSSKKSRESSACSAASAAPQKKAQQKSSSSKNPQKSTTPVVATAATATATNCAEAAHGNQLANTADSAVVPREKAADGSQRTTSSSKKPRQSTTPASTAANAISTVATNRNPTENAAALSEQREKASSQGTAGSQRTMSMSQKSRQSTTSATAASTTNRSETTHRNHTENTAGGGTSAQNATLMSKKIPRKSTAPSIASIIHRAVASNRRQSANASLPKDQVSQRAASAARAAKLAILQQHQQQRRQNLPPGYKLNEKPSPFSAIHYSPHHDIEQALETVRIHIEQHGSPTEWGVWGNCHRNPYKPFGGVGPFLHLPCLYWHIQGQCRSDCPRRENHVDLTQKQAQEIEGALFPAMTTGRQDSPILSLDALVTLIENENNEVDTGITRTTAAAADSAHRTDRGHTANHNTNNPEAIIDLNAASVGPDVEAQRQATTQRKRKRSKGIKIPLLLPVYFGEDFFRSILDSAVPHDFTVRLEEEYDCSWEIEASMDHDNRKRLKLILEGGDFDKLFSCRNELERILCEKLDDDRLVAKFLMDLEKLNKLRNPEAGNQPVLQVRRPGAAQHHDVCWMTEIPINGEDQCATSSDSPSALKLQAAQTAHKRLRYRYDKLNLLLHDRQRPGGTNDGIVSARYYRHPDVPSHLIIWGENRWNVEHCRNDFFSVVALDAGEEDLF